jgi:hypothetical protein
MQMEAMASWKYQAQNADELSLTQGEVVEVHGPAPDADWYTVNQTPALSTYMAYADGPAPDADWYTRVSFCLRMWCTSVSVCLCMRFWTLVCVSTCHVGLLNFFFAVLLVMADNVEGMLMFSYCCTCSKIEELPHADTVEGMLMFSYCCTLMWSHLHCACSIWYMRANISAR